MSGVVAFAPRTGTVEPQAAMACRVTFKARDGIRIYNDDVVCELALPAAEEDTAAAAPARATQGRDLPSRYARLPPIRSANKAAAAGVAAASGPVRLYLGVLARVCLPDEVDAASAAQAFVDRTMDMALHVPASEQPHLWSSQREHEAVSDILSAMLQQVLNEAGFQDALDNIPSERPVYFAQLAGGPAAAAAAQPSTEIAYDTGCQDTVESLLENTLANILSELEHEWADTATEA